MIANSDANGYSQPAFLVINDSDTWVKVWTQAYCTPPLGSNPCEAAPPVSFTTRTLIAVFMGEQPGPLYGIKITQIVHAGSSLVVHVLWTNARGCIQAAEETWPSFIVDIPKTESHIVFASETVFNC